MSDSPVSQGQEPASREEINTALFAGMVMQQANMALMMLGRIPHPETGQRARNPEAARLFIDQLEMLEAKTNGNLSPEESQLLKESLMTLRLAYVETVQSSPAAGTAKTEPAMSSSGATTSPVQGAPSNAAEPPREEESHKKFTKKY